MDTKCVILKRVWSVVLAAAGLFTAPLSATLQAEEVAAVTSKDAVAVPEARESVLADVTAGASARKVMKGSQTYVWDEANVIEVSDAGGLRWCSASLMRSCRLTPSNYSSRWHSDIAPIMRKIPELFWQFGDFSYLCTQNKKLASYGYVKEVAA